VTCEHAGLRRAPIVGGFLTGLRNAAHVGSRSTRPPACLITQAPAARPVGCYDHARASAEMRRPDLAPKSRRSTAEARTTVTVTLAARRTSSRFRDVQQITRRPPTAAYHACRITPPMRQIFISGHRYRAHPGRVLSSDLRVQQRNAGIGGTLPCNFGRKARL
jgi:hypothetical protein